MSRDLAERRYAALQRASAGAALLSCGIALLAIAGWVLDEPHLRAGFFRAGAMHPATALALIFASTSLWLVRHAPARPLAHRLSRSLAAAAALIGLLEVGADLLQEGPGLARLWFPPNPAFESAGVWWGTGAALTVVGAALTWLDAGPETREGPMPAILAVLILAVISVLAAHAYGADMALDLPRPLAVNTAISLLLLAGGVLIARPARSIPQLLAGESETARHFRRLVAPVLLFPFLLGWVLLVLGRAPAYNSQVLIAALAAGNATLCAILLWRNATAAQRREVERAESGARREAVIEGSRDAIFISDPTSRFVMVNRAACDLTGHDQDELLGMRIPDLHEEPDLAAYHRYHDRIMAGEEAVTEAKIRRRDGAKVDVEFNNRRISIGGEWYMHTVARDVTERTKAREALASTLSLLRAALDSTADGILVVDRYGKITTYNSRFAELWRIPEAILASRDDDQALAFVLDQLTEPDAFLRKVRELYRTPDAESFDELAFKDGRRFERHSRPQRISNQVVGRVWSFRDVTDRRRAEDAVRLSDERYRTHYTNQPIPAYVWRRRGDDFELVDANRAGLVITDGRVAEAIGRRAREYYADRPDILADFERCWCTQTPVQREMVYRFRSGTVRNLAVTYVPVPPDTVLVHTEDVTDRNQAVSQLAATLEATADGIVAVNLEGEVVNYNRGWLEMWGIQAGATASRSELLARM